MTLQAEVTDKDAPTNGHTTEQPSITPSYCKTILKSGSRVPTVLIELHYVQECPASGAVTNMKGVVSKFVFGEQDGPHRLAEPLHLFLYLIMKLDYSNFDGIPKV